MRRCQDKATRRNGPCGRPRPRAGFSLIELMLALGLMATGMAMVATIFPAAIVQAKEANNKTLGVLIARNAEVTIKARVRQGHVPTGVLEAVGIGAPGDADPYVLHKYDCRYPGVLEPGVFVDLNNPSQEVRDRYDDARYGWLVLGRRIGSANDCQFVVVPYAKPPAITVEPRLVGVRIEVTRNPDSVVAVFDDTDADFIAIGSPVIHAETGRYASIERIDENDSTRVYLSNGLGLWEGQTENFNVWVVPGASPGALSPAIGLHVFRTPLQP